MEPGDIALRLAEIQDALLALPDDAFSERFELRMERDALRGQAAAAAAHLEDTKSDGELVAELASLRTRMRQLSRRKINLVSQAGESGSGNMGPNLRGEFAVNAQMMQAGGADSIQARIAAIERLLESRGVEIPD